MPRLFRAHHASRITNPIDAFIAAKLVEKNLTPSPEADRVTLIRRLYFVMLGMPPTPEEVAAFVADKKPDAFERLVDKVLDDPRYGERWGRHWLDVIRFAESNGFETNRERPNAWRFRDYVIAAFNERQTVRPVHPRTTRRRRARRGRRHRLSRRRAGGHRGQPRPRADRAAARRRT